MGRKLSVCFFLLLITQCCLLVKYVVKYEGKGDNVYWPFVLLFLPAIIVWLVVTIDNHMRWVGIVWLSYTCALTPMVGWIFGSIAIEDKLDSAEAFGPNSLKAILCLTPLLLLLLLQSATDTSEYRDLLKELSFTVTLDLFDGIEMLEVILDEDENPHGIPKELEIAILAFVCGFFLLSPLELIGWQSVSIREMYKQVVGNKLEKNSELLSRSSSQHYLILHVACHYSNF